MKKFATILSTALILLSLASCRKIKGDGPTVTEVRNVTDFRSIRTEVDGYVHFTQSAAYSVEVRAQRNILDILRTRIQNGELVIDFEGNYNIGNHDRIDIYVTGPSAEGLALGGSGDMDVNGPLRTDHLSLRVSGSGAIRVPDLAARQLNARISGSGGITIGGGTGTEEDFTISGSGGIDAINFAVQDATVHTSGSGTTRVAASGNLDITISGSGSVYYKGHPSITTNISGSGRVQPY